jgi:hypothetical protein
VAITTVHKPSRQDDLAGTHRFVIPFDERHWTDNSEASLYEREVRILESVPRDFATEVGRVAINWSLLETMVDRAIGSILRVRGELLGAMTTGLGIQMRIDMLESLSATLRHKRQRQTLEEIIQAIKDKQSDQNFIIHAAWISASDPDVQGYVLRRKKPRVELWTWEDIARVATEINEIQGRLFGWVMGRTTKAQQRRSAEINSDEAKRAIPPRPPRRSRNSQR